MSGIFANIAEKRELPIHTQSALRPLSTKRRGSIMLLALIVVAIAFVVGLTFLATSSTAMSGSIIMTNHAIARQIAESGIDIARSYIEQNADWRDDETTGPWVTDLAMPYGTLSVRGKFMGIDPADPTPSDASFEDETSTLPRPLFNPPMSGVIGGWDVVRNALIETGATVPNVGVKTSSYATEGSNSAFVSFTLSITGSATFSQTLAESLEPNTIYAFSVDITSSTGISMSNYGLRLLAGSDVVASSDHASTLELPPDLNAIPDPPANPLDPNEYEALLVYTGLLPGSPSTHTLTFKTDNTPPAGALSIELYADATGLVTSVYFDNVSFIARSSEPVTLTSTGYAGESSHIVTAKIVKAIDGSTQIIQWSEP